MSPTLVGILSVGVAVTLLCCTSTKASNETMNTDVSPSGSQEVVCLKSDLEDLRKIADGIKSSYEATESTHEKVVKDMADRMSGIQDQLRTMQLEMSVLTVRSDLDVLRSGLSRLDTEMKEKVSTVSIASGNECPENQTNHQLESEPAWKPAVEDLTASLEQLSERFTSLEVKNTETEKEWAPAVENLTVSLGALSERINSLEAKTAALGKENADLKMQLTAKRCESGSQVFQPHDQPTARGGSRTHTKHVTFSSPFASVPVVFSALYHLDVYTSGANLRIHTAVSNIDKDGFDLAVNEWASSHTYGASVRWMACSN